MRYPLAAIFFIAVLFFSTVGYITTSVLIDSIEEELTSPGSLALLGSNAAAFQAEIEVMKLIFGVSMVIFFLFTVVAFVVDALRSEPERYEPYGRDYP